MKEKIIALNNKLKEAARVYYQGKDEIMTNREYDALYDELVKLEKETGIILPDSVTQNVGFEVVSKLVKERHEEKALSLDKTKDRDSLRAWLKDNEALLSWKLDGLTIVLTYDNGSLTKAVTRGNGEIGEVVTHNAKFFKGVPHKINYTGHLVLRGEALMTYSEFNRINALIEEEDDKYKNPRNLASGTVRQLDSKESSKKEICFRAFELVTCDKDFTEDGSADTHLKRFNFLEDLGFDVVEHVLVDKNTLLDNISIFEEKMKFNDFPSDGLVLLLNDVEYGKSLGTTGKFPRNGMAFKWADELAETTIREIEWSASRTGLINPVAVFDPVELEGTTVKRATAHNVSILKKLKLSVGSKITVYKANMIIPTINENVAPNGPVIIPDKCPVCGAKTKIKTSKDGIETLLCPNKDCAAKNLKKFTHFVSREAMNIYGLSESKLERFVDLGYVKTYVDLYKLSRYKDNIVNLDGFGEKSYDNLIEAIEKSKDVDLKHFIYSLGLSNIGKDASEKINTVCKGDYDKFLSLLDENFDFSSIDGIGEVINDSIYNNLDLFKSDDISELRSYLSFKAYKEKDIKSSAGEGKVFVITGTVNKFSNRNAVKQFIESNGGKVTGSVSKNTDYLINNDVTSTSSKNKKAKELDIPIISEDELISLFEN